MAYYNDNLNLRYQKELTLGDALNAYLKAIGADSKIKEMRVLQAWDKVVGSYIAGDTAEINICNGVLFIRLNSPIIRNEISMRKTQIINRLNEEIGENIVKSIMVR